MRGTLKPFTLVLLCIGISCSSNKVDKVDINYFDKVKSEIVTNYNSLDSDFYKYGNHNFVRIEIPSNAISDDSLKTKWGYFPLIYSALKSKHCLNIDIYSKHQIVFWLKDDCSTFNCDVTRLYYSDSSFSKLDTLNLDVKYMYTYSKNWVQIRGIKYVAD